MGNARVSAGRVASADRGLLVFQDTFLNLWYWVVLILFWGVIGNYTFGIPNELLMRSTRTEEEGEIFDRYARRNLGMFSRAIGKRGYVVTTLTAFILAMVGSLAFLRGWEGAMGLFVILAPMAARWWWGGRMIERLHACQPSPEEMRRSFIRERRLTGVTACVSIILAFWAATAWHGPGWSEALFRGY